MRLREDASLLLKRDDLTGFSLAGNKARPLEFLMADALARACDVVVTGGAPSSNFVGACAHAALIAGLDCEVLVAGDPASSTPLQLAHACGASVRLAECDRSVVDDAIAKRASELESQGRRPYAIPRGGATAIGALGFADAAFEVRGQLDDLAIDPNRATIVLPVGSGASLAGFMAGSAAMELDWRVVGVSVSRPSAQMAAHVMNLSLACSALMGTISAASGAFTLVDCAGESHAPEGDGGGARLMRESEGVLLDSHYGIPAFDVAMELPATEREPVLLWQTGGLPAAIEFLSVGVSDSLVMGRQ
jgi:1-aminocyclopropane-1-carboxylate deaminase/D-cysteine desulfhydrase-like pyridoxal-dependent ACC family enzyme